MSLVVKLCKRGHDLVLVGTYIQPTGTISCSKCKRENGNNYANSVKGKQKQKKYSKTDKGRQIDRDKQAGYRKSGNYDLQIINRGFVYNAKRNGQLIIKNVCTDCGKQGYTEIHHEKYHNPPLLIDIRELCKKCHGIADKLIL